MKTPLFHLQYEIDDPLLYTEVGSDAGAKLCVDDIEDAEVRRVLQLLDGMSYKQTLLWLSEHSAEESMAVLPLSTRTPQAVEFRLEGQRPKLCCVSRPLHTIKMLDEVLHALNLSLEEGTYLWCHSMTAVLRRKLLYERYPKWIAMGITGVQYLWHRVCPKLRLTRRLYFALTQGKNRTFNRVEILGRLYRAGFEVLDEHFRDGEFYVVCRKASLPIEDDAPTGSPIIHLSRIGKGGKEIVVHKFRTMYTYSEYIQDYVYHYQSLERGGKFRNDYRVNFFGRFFRRFWIDELPMLYNLLRGDIKLVGVRPLSRQYFSLYTPEMQELRIKTKPGLLPPFYYDRQTPSTLEEVQASERRYIEAYLQHPFRTDWRYFWGIVGNIIFRRKRSK